MALFKKQITRYVDANGKRVKKSTPGAQKVKDKSKKYYGRYRQSDGQLKEVPLFKDKEAARQELARLVKGVERQEAGLVDPYTAHRKKPLVCRSCKSTGIRVSDDRPCKVCDGAHVSDFRQHLKATGNGDRHIAATVRHVRRIIVKCGFDIVSDIDAAAVETCLQQLRDGDTNISIGTSNQHLTAAKSFTR
jgi:hypothetical protein